MATGKVTGKMTLDQFRSVIDINLTGVFLTVRECLERMINNNCKGLICLISSTGSLRTAGQINYSSSKAAMSVFPKVLTAEFFRRGLADKIRCVAVAPGYVGTEMVRKIPPGALDKIIEQVPIGRLISRRSRLAGSRTLSQRVTGRRGVFYSRRASPGFQGIGRLLGPFEGGASRLAFKRRENNKYYALPLLNYLDV